MDCPPPRKKKLGQYNVAYFQYHMQRLENEVVLLTQTLSTYESNDQQIQRKLQCRQLQLEQYKKRISKLEDANQQLKKKTISTDQCMQKQILNIQRKLKCGELQLAEYKKRIAKLEDANRQLNETLAKEMKATTRLQNDNDMLNNTLKSQKQFNERKISELNDIINDFKQRLKSQSQTIKTQSEIILQQKKVINDANDSDEFEDDDVISIGESDSSVSQSSEPNTQDKLFNATPDDTDKIVFGDDSDYNPMDDEDESISSYD